MPQREPVKVVPRKFNRYFLSLRASFAWRDAKDNPHREGGLTRDMSLAGAFVLSPACPPASAIVLLEIFLPPTHVRAHPMSIRGEGRVVRVEVDGADASRWGFAVVTRKFVLRRELIEDSEAAGRT